MGNLHPKSACTSTAASHSVSRRLQVGVLAIIALLAQGARAELSETLEYTDYPVSADNAQSLGMALNNTSPIRQDGKTFHAYTAWRVNWNYRWLDAPDGQCRIIQVSTKLSATIELPRLERGSPSQHERFARYHQALHEHELGHYQFGRNAALEIDRELLAMPAMDDCQKLVATANRLAHRIIERYKDEERNYDLITVHGRLQGAHLADYDY